jgi:hypothetical protein
LSTQCLICRRPRPRAACSTSSVCHETAIRRKNQFVLFVLFVSFVVLPLRS